MRVGCDGHSFGSDEGNNTEGVVSAGGVCVGVASTVGVAVDSISVGMAGKVGVGVCTGDELGGGWDVIVGRTARSVSVMSREANRL